MSGGLAAWLQRHRRSILFLMSVLAAGGLLAALNMPVSLFPAIQFPRVRVSIDAGDRPAQQMAIEVTRPVEQALRGVPNVQAIASTSSRGSTDIDLRFAWGTDIIQSALQVEAALNQVLPQLPAGTRFNVRPMDPTKFPVVAYSLTSPTATPVQLHAIAEYQLLPLISSIHGVRAVQVQGGETPEYRVTVDPARLAALGLSLQDVEAALSAANVVQAVGRLQRQDRLYLLLADTRFSGLDAIRHSVLRTGSDGVVELDDVATVSLATVPRWQSETAGGKPAVLINVYQQLGGNTVAISRDITAALAAFRDKLPADVRIHQWYDQSGLITASAASVRDAIILGVLFATAVLFLFLRNWKLTLIAALVVPAVLAATSLLLYALGMSFNIMTLGGMAAAVGLIIDDVIVMLEHLVRRGAQRGYGTQTLLAAAREFTQPLAGSSTATVIIFVPLAFLGGVTGAFFKALSLTMGASLVISFFFAWLALPLLADHLLGARAVAIEHGGRSTHAVQGWYRRLMTRLLARPVLLLLGLLPLLALGTLGYFKVPTGFMPEMQEGGFVLDYRTRPGTSLRESDRLIAQVEHILASTPGVDTWSRRTGAQLGGGITEANEGDFFVRLKSPAGQAALMQRIVARIQQQVPGFEILDTPQPMQDLIGDLTGSPRPVVIRLFGDDWSQLVTLAPKVAAAVGKVRGLTEVQDGLNIAGDAVEIKVDRIKAALEGITPAAVTRQLDTYLSGTVTTHVLQGQQVLGVRVWVAPRDRDSLRRIEALRLRAADGHLLPLARIATLKLITGQPQITRYDLKPMVAVSARIEGRGFGNALADVKRVLARPGLLPPGVYYTLGGLYQQQQIAFRGLAMVFGAATALVFLALLFLYERFRVALAIMAAPLLAASAVFFGLWISGQTLNITALMGLTMILGIVTEVGVFYFSELQLLRSEGMAFGEAIIQAGVNRLRPIAMTTLAAALALLPLALGIGQGSAMQQPLAIAIIAGLAVQMPLVLVLVPVLYALLARREAN
ncbi:MAG: efflux RND transporter permease subunit [Metallibacterium scheffleri]|jgi:CzcA family heavy metal efflux pump|uniref:efflux RND transporter permease subunit n=1 Tax=Metallibacterium scheffleri TaxID=993689 RepID=UPI0026EA5AED|nr:efflux RND transporter permease subunit [Metallibacterium scheffleri]MCK9368251.1 efflux RND transporter permease subunit [Metallibacterium scheffleri]